MRSTLVVTDSFSCGSSTLQRFSEPGQVGGIVADRARSGGIQALERDRRSNHFLFGKILFEEMVR